MIFLSGILFGKKNKTLNIISLFFIDKFYNMDKLFKSLDWKLKL